MNRIFIPGQILLPKEVDMTLWSVIACDQFTSQPEYWDTLDETVGDSPSALRLMLPEAYLETRDCEEETRRINASMEKYLSDGVFAPIDDSYIYVEREMTVGGKRRGILGLLDLEAYDYRSDAKTPVRCTEGTIESRLPARVKVRQDAAVEMPHVVVFADDPEWTVFRGLEEGEILYDFELMDGGGRIRGRRVEGEAAARVEEALSALFDGDYLEKKYALNGRDPVCLAMGDGNHSLATAKLLWERLKPGLSEAEREKHPARRSLVELVNIHDETVAFEPIHRLIFETATESFFSEAQDYFTSARGEGEERHEIRLLSGGACRTAEVKGCTVGEAIELAQDFCVDYVNRHSGRIDYIHDDEAAVSMSEKENCCALLMPTPKKDELFSTIIRSGAFPAKSFSIGPARDKRYYLECRRIKSSM